MRYKPLFIALLLALSACAHPYIGVKVNPMPPLWCNINTANESCVIETEHLKFVFDTGRDPATGEYTINGYAEAISVKSFSRFHTEKSNFYFVLAFNGTITDVVSFMLINPNVKGKIPINIKFKSPLFDSITITYEFVMS